MVIKNIDDLTDSKISDAQTSLLLAGSSRRKFFIGRTPGKNSKTGRKVLERMREEGRVVTTDTGDIFIKSLDETWVPLSECDMSHLEDVVKWWNREGYQYGKKSKKVREWMLNSKNYELEHFSTNRSRGGALKDRYIDPKK